MRLRDYQTESVNFLAARKRGMIVAPAGSGKTVIGAAALARVLRPGMKVTWIANTKEQVEQAGAAISRMPGPDNVDIRICCAASNPAVLDSDVVVFDECHHIPAESWLNIVSARLASESKAVWGLTATPWHEDEERNEVVRKVFQEFHTIERARVLASGHLVEGKVWMHDIDEPGQFDEEINARVETETKERVRRFPALRDDGGYIKCCARIKRAAEDIEKKCGREFLLAASRSRIVFTDQPEDVQLLLQEASEASRARDDYVYRYHESKVKWQITQEFVQKNENRNNKIVELLNTEAAAGESVLALVFSIEHGAHLAERVPSAALVHSKIGIKKRRELIAAFRDGTLRVLFATSLADEGLDIPRASRLVLVAGGRSAGKLEQRAGRVLRPFEGKTGGVIHDFMDRGCCFALAQARARMKVYENLGYEPDIVKKVSSVGGDS